MKRSALAIAAAAATILSLSACGDVATKSSDSPAVTSASTSATAKNALTLKWGESADIGDVTYTVTKPVAHKLSAYYATDKPGPAMAVKVTMRNNSEETMSTGSARIKATLPDSAVESVFDSGTGLAGDPSADILPGRSASWLVGFMSAADAPGLVVQAATGIGSGRALWAS